MFIHFAGAPEVGHTRGSTPYGDVYIPEKDNCKSFKRRLWSIRDGYCTPRCGRCSPGKKPNSFRWTCVYLHNNGYSLE